MTKLNRKEIMNRAWAIYRSKNTAYAICFYGKTSISVCLTMAWREYKLANMTVRYEVVYRDTNEVKLRSYDECQAYRNCEYHNKVFFDRTTFVREVFSKAA